MGSAGRGRRGITPDAPERRGWLFERGAVGRLQAAVEQLLADPGTLAAAVRLLLDRHFTPVLAELICAAVHLDIPALDLAGSGGTAQAGRLRPGAAGSRKRFCAPMRISARCADSMVRSAVTRSGSRRLHARNRGFAAAFRSAFPNAMDVTTGREYALDSVAKLARRAKKAAGHGQSEADVFAA